MGYFLGSEVQVSIIRVTVLTLRCWQQIMSKGVLGLALDDDLKVIIFSFSFLTHYAKDDISLQVLQVEKGGPCDGHIQVDDILTHVDSEEAKDRSTVSQLCSKAWKVMIDLKRVTGDINWLKKYRFSLLLTVRVIGAGTFDNLRYLIRIPLSRKGQTTFCFIL